MPTWDDVVATGCALPGTEESTGYGRLCLRVSGKVFASNGSHVPGYIVIWCSAEEKAALLSDGDPAFATAPHYDGHNSILVDLARVERGQLDELVTEAWRLRAPKRVRAQADGAE